MKDKFPAQYTVFLSGPPGVGKFEFCLDLAEHYLKKGEDVLYVTTQHAPSEIIARGKGLEPYVESASDTKLRFVDCYSWSVKKDGEKNLFVDGLSDLNELYVAVEEGASGLKKPVRILFDSLSPLFLYNQENALIKFIQVLSSKVKEDYGFIIYTLQEGVHDPQAVNALVSLVDGHIEMKFEEKDTLMRMLRVHHMRGFSITPKWQFFEITKEGFRLRHSYRL